MATKPAGWGTAVLVIFVVVLCVFGPQIMHRLDLGSSKSAKELPGDWVGPFTLTGRYKPDLYGATAGPHTGGLLYLHAYRQSPNIDWVEAKGEICITGESVARPIQLEITEYKPDGSFSADLNAQPPLGAFPWVGRVTTDTLTLGNNIELGINATLHRSTRAAFRQQSTCAHSDKT